MSVVGKFNQLAEWKAICKTVYRSIYSFILFSSFQFCFPPYKFTDCSLSAFSSPALYISQYDSRLLRRTPSNTEVTPLSQTSKVYTKLSETKDPFTLAGKSRIEDQKLLQQELQAKLKDLEERIALQKSGWDPKLPIIYAITPTYRRFLQKAELTRLSQTLKHVKNFHWIVVEDSHEKTNLVKRFLSNCGLKHTHLNVRTPIEMRRSRNKPRWTKSRGVEQRNVALDWLRKNVKANETKGVVYFADDDNTYDIRIFEEVRPI